MKRRELNFYREEKTFWRSSYLYFIAAAMVLVGFWILDSAGFNYVKEVTVVNESTAPILANSKPAFAMLEKIREGVELLRQSLPLDYKTKYDSVQNGVKVKTGDLIEKQIALAILDKNTGEVFEKRVWVREQEIKNYRETGIINLDPANLPTSDVDRSIVMSDVGINVQVRWWNSFNTLYEIEGRPDLMVVANKYLLPSSYIVGLPEKSKTKYTDIIYIPYSKSLHLPEIITAGKKYLDNNVNQAFGELDAGRVMSVSLSGYFATEGVTKEFIKSIILAEHIDPESFNLANDGGQELTERVLAILGANQEQAYRYTGSPAGASGLAQFIKSTYEAIVSKYPEARLIKDYNLGMADHVNAIKAMVLFFDNYKKEIDNKITRRDVIGQIGITEEMLAAAYNGGANKVVRSVNKYGLAWISSQLNLPHAAMIFKEETVNYIKKFRSIKDLELF